MDTPSRAADRGRLDRDIAAPSGPADRPAGRARASVAAGPPHPLIQALPDRDRDRVDTLDRVDTAPERDAPDHQANTARRADRADRVDRRPDTAGSAADR